MDDTDCPELYDLRLRSGVVRLEEGVALLTGMYEGDWAVDRGRTGTASVGACMPVEGNGGAVGAMDSRFMRLASVGLTVRAPNPVA